MYDAQRTSSSELNPKTSSGCIHSIKLITFFTCSPDDIHTLYSGRTVEINNTDAEGRLVLSDGVAYAQKDLKANIILDMATLTGAQVISEINARIESKRMNEPANTQ